MDSWFCLVWQSLRYWLIGWAVLLRSLSRKLGMSVLGELWNDVFLFLSLVLFHFFFFTAYAVPQSLPTISKNGTGAPGTLFLWAGTESPIYAAPRCSVMRGHHYCTYPLSLTGNVIPAGDVCKQQCHSKKTWELEEPAQRARVHWGRSSSMSRWTRDSTGLQSKCKCEINI